MVIGLAACGGRGGNEGGAAPTALPIATAAPHAVGPDYSRPAGVVMGPPNGKPNAKGVGGPIPGTKTPDDEGTNL